MFPLMPKLPPGVHRLFRLPPSRRRLLREMDDELQAHLAMRVEDLHQLGMSQADAEAEALRRFGDTDEFREYAARRAGRRSRRIGWAWWLEEARQDARVALRQFRQAPALAAVIVLTLALCIGATTAAYGVVRHLLLAPLPYPGGNRIVSLELRSPVDGEFHFNNLDPELFRHWVARSRTLEDFAAIGFLQKGPLAGAPRGAEDTMGIAVVTPSFLPLLRVRPALGRWFTPEDARPGAQPVALLGEGLWRRSYGSDPDVIGRAITVDGLPRTIIGVVPREVAAPNQRKEPLDVLLPQDLHSPVLVSDAFARLKPNVTSASASRELDAILRTLPDTGGRNGLHAEVTTAAEQLDPRRRRAVEVLFAAAAGLLLIGCADVAGLLLIRGWARRREFAIRQSLGASRGRLARQLLTESLLLAVPSGALGLLVAWLGLRGAVAMRPWTLGFLDTVRLDEATLLWTAAASVATGVLFGVGPALFAGGRSVDGALRTGATGGGLGRAAGRAHAALVVAQIALSVVFLAAAGVLGRSFVSLLHTPVGYEPAGLVEMSVRGAPAARPMASGPSAREGGVANDAVARAVREVLAATPGVSEVAVGTLPLNGLGPGLVAIDGPAGVQAVDIPTTAMAYVSPDYLSVARIPLVRGRGFVTSPEAATGEVVINETLARRLWPGCLPRADTCDALGARVRLPDAAGGEWLTVVGVAGDVRMPGAVAELFDLQMYRPTSAADEFVGSLVLRARGDTARLRPLLARATERAGAGVTVGELVTAKWMLEFSFGAPRFAVLLFGAFSVLAVGLAGVGLFGIVAFAVARRTREIGIRVALGANPAALTRAILGQGLRLVAVGCAAGLLGAYGVARALTALVYGVSPADPASLGGAVVLLAVVALAASAVPVRRALRVDPTDALRAE